MRDLTCQLCGQHFQSKTLRKCCDRHCATKLTMQRSGRSSWRTQETDLIKELAGSRTAPDIVKAIQQMEARQGWQVRTDRAILKRLNNLTRRQRPSGDNVNMAELAKALNISHGRARGWCRNSGLYCDVWTRTNSAIPVIAFRQWAIAHPDKVAGIESERLNRFIQDREFCDRVEQMPRAQGRNLVRKVKNLDTGVIYPSVKAASKASYICKTGIPPSIKRGGTSGGCRWAYVN